MQKMREMDESLEKLVAAGPATTPEKASDINLTFLFTFQSTRPKMALQSEI
jgi:hypothetical protein